MRRRLQVYRDRGVTARDFGASFEREGRATRGWDDCADVAVRLSDVLGRNVATFSIFYNLIFECMAINSQPLEKVKVALTWSNQVKL